MAEALVFPIHTADDLQRYREVAGLDKQPDPLIEAGLHDAGNAERLVALHGQRMRYCHPMRRWLIWDGRRWRFDERGEAMRLAKETMAITLQRAVEERNELLEKWAARSLDSRRLDGMLKLAQSDLPVEVAELDADRDLLNVENGVLHLPSGTLRPHDPRLLMTKMAAAPFEREAGCPRFDAFLARILGARTGASASEQDRAERLAAYLQTAFGYSSTGWSSEKVVFILHGVKDSGKTTLLACLRTILADYSAQIQAESLMMSQRQVDANQLADLSDLRGARLAVSSETEEGMILNQARLKRLTQGQGKIKSCRKYENPIEFPETHTLWIDTNKRFRLRDADDDATLRRLVPIPFPYTIPVEEQDKQLPAKLVEESAGILAWLAAGALAWYAHGLGSLPEAQAAREEWKAEDDQLARFLDDCTTREDDYSQPAGAVYKAYHRWCEESGEHSVLSAGRFKQRLTAKGIEQRESKTGRYYVGLRLREAWQ